MKVLFLDVDGVLNSNRNLLAYGCFPWPNVPDGLICAESKLDPIAIGMIRKVCEDTGAVIVLHSTWRENVDPVEFGLKYDLPIIGSTDADESKPDSIQSYLKAHPTITKYAVVDDHYMRVPRELQVTPGMNNGLQYEHAVALKEILSDEKTNRNKNQAAF